MKHVSEMTEVEFRAARAGRTWRAPVVVDASRLRSPSPPAPADPQARRDAIDAELKAAFAKLYAIDPADTLQLVDRRRIKTDAEGRITNAAELATDVKKAKPHFFAPDAREMTSDEFLSAVRERTWRR